MGSRWWAVGMLASAACLGLGCATEAEGGGPALDPVDEREELDDDDARESSLDAAVEQMVDLGNGDFADEATAEERECVEDHPDLDEIDFDAVMSDPDAIEERVALVRILVECIPRAEMFAPLFANALRASSVDLSDAESECVLEEVLANASDPARVLVVADSMADVQVLLSALEECLTPEHYAELTLAPGSGPQSYGDDERLDSMYDDCSDGELRACDLLWLQTTEGSEYEEHAATCGGTEEDADAFCSEEAELNDSGFSPPDSPGLEILGSDCEEGDLTACDLLFMLVPPGHALENVGFTCGGRIAVGAVPDCRTRFG